jgi:hypothetical protein
MIVSGCEHPLSTREKSTLAGGEINVWQANARLALAVTALKNG